MAGLFGHPLFHQRKVLCVLERGKREPGRNHSLGIEEEANPGGDGSVEGGPLGFDLGVLGLMKDQVLGDAIGDLVVPVRGLLQEAKKPCLPDPVASKTDEPLEEDDD